MNDQDEEAREGSFKVKDKRRFDEHGNVREEGLKEVNASGARSKGSASESRPPAGQQDAVSHSKESLEDEGAYGPIDFGSFVMSLATQALMQMGEMPGPAGLDIPVNTAAAKQTIDILGMLEEKTKGNLDAQEERLMREMLHTLRMSFLQKS